MAVAVPVLDIYFLDAHSAQLLVIGDSSDYGNFTVSTPTIEITIPNWGMKSLAFVKGNIQVYNSETLGLTCDGECNIEDLPDGIWAVKYSIYPAYKYYVQKTFIRIDSLQTKFDTTYLKLDFMNCDQEIKEQDKQFLDTIQEYINGAVAAANKCANKLAMDLYRKANDYLENYLTNHCYLQ